MRAAFAAGASCFIFLVYAIQPAASQTSAPVAPATPATPLASTAAANASTVPANGDAAAKHAKRTACLQETKARKLVGAEKTAFLKNCIDAPPEAISASRVSPANRP
jgi:hypothetical protein